MVNIEHIKIYVALKCSFSYFGRIEIGQFVNGRGNITPGTGAEYDGRWTYGFRYVLSRDGICSLWLGVSQSR